MEKNKTILRSGLFLLFFAFIFSIGAAFYLKLDIPVFFENYKEVNLYKRDDGRYQESDFMIQYLTNSSDTRIVTDIYFKEAPDLDFRADEFGFRGGWSFPVFNAPQNQRPGKIYGRYSLRTIYIKFEQGVEKNLDGTQLENAIITFNNGDVMNSSIGKIVLSENKFDRDYLSQERSGGSSDGTDSSTYLVKESIVLEKLDSPFLENIKDNIEITIDEKDYRDISGIEYKAGDRFTIESKLKSPNDILDKYKSSEFDFDLYFKDNGGNLHKTKSHFIHFRPFEYDMKLLELISYLQQRGAI